MNFAQARFWGLLLAGLMVIGCLRLLFHRSSFVRQGPFDKLALLGLGLFLLACVSTVTFFIFLAVAIGTYLGLHWIMRLPPAQQGKYLYCLIPAQLLPLLYYKYADFAVEKVLRLPAPALHSLIIPVGISFYTFQKVAFVVDTLVHRQPLPRFLDYMNFAGFFPQIVAGPIERRQDLLPQMEQFRFRWSARDIDTGASWIVLGLFFKLCLADNLSEYFSAAPTANAYLIWLENILFGLRIYYDFAGYSLVALGLARCLGIRLTLNFRSPYASASLIEFWRRWHVTLSQWFRDYVYIPLGGGRVRWWMFNIAAVFIISGIWHGAGWNFALWGTIHGAGLIVNRRLNSRIHLPVFFNWLLTMLAAFAAWLCFYENRTSVLLDKIRTLATPTAYGPSQFRMFLNDEMNPGGFVMTCFLAVTALTLLAEWYSLKKHDDPYYLLRRPLTLIGLVVATVLLAPDSNNGFIYFAF